MYLLPEKIKYFFQEHLFCLRELTNATVAPTVTKHFVKTEHIKVTVTHMALDAVYTPET